MAQCPGRDHKVVAGDRVAVLGTEDELRWGASIQGGPRGCPSAGWHHQAYRPPGVSGLDEDNKALTFVVAGLLALVVVATITLRFTFRDGRPRDGRLDLLTAAYFTIETVATVGYGDYSFAAQDGGMKVFAIVLIVVGVALVSTAFALFTNILVSRRIERSLGRRQVPGMAGHIMVIGLGAVGIA